MGHESVSLLLDTHVWLWASAMPEKLGKATQALLLDAKQKLYVSSVSTLEVARLASLRQIRLTSPVDAWCERARAELGAEAVVIDDRVAVEAYALPGSFHADPADRMLVATARVHGWRIVTADVRIVEYRGVRTHDARR